MCTELRIVHLLRHNHNCSLDTRTTVIKLFRHIQVIMVRPVILYMAGIVVGYWRNGCLYRNIAGKVGLHSNTVYGIIKRFRERVNFVCGRRTRRPRKTNDRDDRVSVSPCHGKPTIQCIEAEACMAAKREYCNFPPNGE